MARHSFVTRAIYEPRLPVVSLSDRERAFIDSIRNQGRNVK
jgi:hypothetical protein